MKEKISYIKAKYLIYLVIESINKKDIEDLIKICNKTAKDIDKRIKDIELALISLRNVYDNSVFNLPPFDSCKLATENVNFCIDKLSDLFKTIINQLELIEDGKSYDIKLIKNILPKTREDLAKTIVNTPTPKLIRKKINFMDIKENFNSFIGDIKKLKEAIFELMNLLDIYLMLARGYVFNNFNKKDPMLLEEYMNHEIGNLVSEFKLRVSCSNYIIWYTKEFKKDYKVFTAIMSEFAKRIKKGGI